MSGDTLLALPLEKVPFVCLDTETTGLYAKGGDRICEIAMAHAKGGRIGRTFESLVNPGRPISAAASRVNGITDDMVAEAPAFGEIAGEVVSFMEGRVLVIHNAPFDMGFLTGELGRAGRGVPDCPVVDTLSLLRRNFSLGSNALPAACLAFGVKQEDAHRALGDVSATMELFFRIVERLGPDSVPTLGELLNLQWYGREGRSPWSEAIEQAIRESRTITIRYRSASSRVTTREVRPLRIDATYGGGYLVAHCLLRGEERTFRLDRIVKIALVE